MTKLTISALVGCALSTNLFAQGLKIGVINSEAVVQNFEQFRRAEAQLGKDVEGWTQERAAWEADMQRLQKDIEDRQNRLAAGQNILSDVKKKALQGEIDSLKGDFTTRVSRQSEVEQERFNARKTELLAGVFETVNKTIEEIGEQEGYDFIIDASNGSVVYAKNPTDLTSQLLDHLEKK
jgi:outer membrane protein